LEPWMRRLWMAAPEFMRQKPEVGPQVSQLYDPTGGSAPL
jgi:hypothetical protein